MCVCVCLVWLRACLTEGGGWKQARACEEDADQSRVAMALEVQEQVSGELASVLLELGFCRLLFNRR